MNELLDTLVDLVVVPHHADTLQTKAIYYELLPEVTLTFTVANGAVSDVVVNLQGRDRTAKPVQ